MKLQNLRSIDISTLTAGGLADHVTRMNQLDQTANNNNNSILSNTVLSNYLQRQAIKHGHFYQAGISQNNALGNASAIANDNSKGYHGKKKKKKKKKKLINRKDIIEFKAGNSDQL